jgi:hypothetical protein
MRVRGATTDLPHRRVQVTATRPAGSIAIWHCADAFRAQLSHLGEFADLQAEELRKTLSRMWHEIDCVWAASRAPLIDSAPINPLLVTQDNIHVQFHVCHDPIAVPQKHSRPKLQKDL